MFRLIIHRHEVCKTEEIAIDGSDDLFILFLPFGNDPGRCDESIMADTFKGEIMVLDRDLCNVDLLRQLRNEVEISHSAGRIFDRDSVEWYGLRREKRCERNERSKNGEEKVDSHKLWTVSGTCYKGVCNRIGRIVDLPDLLQNEVEEELGKLSQQPIFSF